MTVTPQAAADYDLPTNVDTTSPLVDPSHSELHNTTNRAVLDLNNRVGTLEQVLAGLTMPSGSIEQARLAAHQWVGRGLLSADQTILMPLIWNMTGRSVTFQAAKATVLTPANADIEVDIVIGSVLTGPTYDVSTQSSILQAGKMVITPGEYFSASLGQSDFGTEQAVGTYIAAYIEKTGSVGSPGADLTLQLNRNL